MYNTCIMLLLVQHSLLLVLKALKTVTEQKGYDHRISEQYTAALLWLVQGAK